MSPFEIPFVDGAATGLPVVFIHGFPFNQTMWTDQIKFLAGTPGVRPITYDIRGLGKSEPGDGPYFLEHLVDELFALLDHLKIQKAVFCGLSMGGYIALRATERAPDRVAGLVLCDTRSESDPDEAKLKRAKSLELIREHGLDRFAAAFIPTVFSPETLEKNRTLVERTRAMICSNSAKGVCAAQVALATRTDTTSSLSRIHVPTLLVFGEHDTLTPPAVGKAMAARVGRHAKLHVIPGAGHLSPMENPKAFNEALGRFLHDSFKVPLPAS